MFLLQLENQLVDLAGGYGIQSRSGFVQQQDVGVERQRARQPYALLHAARNIRRHLLEIAFHAHTRKQFLDSVRRSDSGIPVLCFSGKATFCSTVSES